jgi:hypothetical protein
MSDVGFNGRRISSAIRRLETPWLIDILFCIIDNVCETSLKNKIYGDYVSLPFTVKLQVLFYFVFSSVF